MAMVNLVINAPDGETAILREILKLSRATEDTIDFITNTALDDCVPLASNSD